MSQKMHNMTYMFFVNKPENVVKKENLVQRKKEYTESLNKKWYNST